MNKKSEVSKGLRSLLSNIEKTNNPVERGQLVRELTNSIATISPELIEINPYQVRTEFDADQLLELAQSIKTSGLIQPITVRAIGGNKYQLISGERRLRASKMAGINEIPAYIRVANDQEMLEMALVENIQRADLNAVEIAISYQRLMDECNLTHEALSARVGKNRSTVTNYVRLLKLPAQIQSSVKEGSLSMGHARALAGIENLVLQIKIYKEAVDKELSVRALEQLIKSYQSSNPVGRTAVSSQPNPEIHKIRDHFRQIFGAKVEIRRENNGKGTIILPFNSDDEFNNIVEILTKEN
ncbi:MAG: ParB/RepB/Spo0J family partition protein [Saprospiraceae bacterium]|jgi:ParB family chromosome partitioning protein|nr:ParB/RepB/Spo0J family partition protein [Saprospiraceae bacterium]MBL0025024.1 ParB/RepB/Spo0J family partition protein [Saprospiraceae bacterium]